MLQLFRIFLNTCVRSNRLLGLSIKSCEFLSIDLAINLKNLIASLTFSNQIYLHFSRIIAETRYHQEKAGIQIIGSFRPTFFLCSKMLNFTTILDIMFFNSEMI